MLKSASSRPAGLNSSFSFLGLADLSGAYFLFLFFFLVLLTFSQIPAGKKEMLLHNHYYSKETKTKTVHKYRCQVRQNVNKNQCTD